MERGAIMLIGSTEGQQDEVILREFMRLAGDRESHVVILADRTELPTLFAQTGSGTVDIVALSEPTTARDIPHMFQQATGIWILSDADNLVVLNNASPFAATLRERYTRGAVIADSVSMAVLLPTERLAMLTAVSHGQLEGLDLKNGLHALSVSDLYCYHVLAGYGNSLGSVLMRNPGALWLAIDPQTAVTIRDSTLAVLGKGTVFVIDVREAHNNQHQDDERVQLEHVKLHILSNGESFDLMQFSTDRDRILESV